MHILRQVCSLLLFKLQLVLNALNVINVVLVYLLGSQPFTIIRISTSTSIHVQRAHAVFDGVLSKCYFVHGTFSF